jgi:hypothetical protein
VIGRGERERTSTEKWNFFFDSGVRHATIAARKEVMFMGKRHKKAATKAKKKGKKKAAKKKKKKAAKKKKKKKAAKRKKKR